MSEAAVVLTRCVTPYDDDMSTIMTKTLAAGTSAEAILQSVISTPSSVLGRGAYASPLVRLLGA